MEQSFGACAATTDITAPLAREAATTSGEVYFGVYCAETGGVYLLPLADVPLRRMGTLRVDPPRNNQRKAIRYAADYEIGA